MLTLADVQLALDDLFTKRHADLVRSKAGKFFEPELAELRKEIDALPPELAPGTPLAHELGEVDGRHDACGRAIFFATESVLHDPNADDATRAAAGAVRAAFVPALAALKDTFADEAQHALDSEPKLKSLKAELDAIAAPAGGTLAPLAKQLVAEGKKLHALLSDRGDVVRPDRKAAAALRPRTIGVLNDLRKKLVQEVGKDKKLPRDLVAHVFGYVDVLEAHRRSPKKAEPPPPPPPAAAPIATPGS